MPDGDRHHESVSRVLAVRSARESLTSEVLERLRASQELCAVCCHQRDRSERLLTLSLQDRISELESWRASLGAASRRLREQARLLADEGDTLRVVAARLDAELAGHVLAGGGARGRGRQEDVETELRRELKLLKSERIKFTKQISKVEESLAQHERLRCSIERDMQMKSHSMRVDRELTSLRVDSVPVAGSNLGLPTQECWRQGCRSLLARGTAAAAGAALLREECREMRALLSCAAQAQAARADNALRRRTHQHRHLLEDLLWQMQEIDRDICSLDEEQLAAERGLLECMAQQRRAASRVASRASKAGSERCEDDAQRRMRSDVKRLKCCVAELRGDIERIRRLKNALTETRGDIECCAQDRRQALEADLACARRRGAEPEADCDIGTEAAPSSPRRQGTLESIVEGDE